MFASLIKLKDHIDDLIKKLDSNGIDKNDTFKKLVIYGPSRSGKSTLLARLLSSMSPSSFNEMNAISGLTKVEGTDIIIGSTGKGVTIVPNIGVIDNIKVIDLPGYDDKDTTRRPIISILNKITLSACQNVQILVPFDLRYLSSFAQRLISDQYTSKIVDLLSQSNSLPLSNMLFVYTNLDRAWPSIISERRQIDGDSVNIATAINNIFTEMIVDSVNSSNQFESQIYSSMKTNFIIVDYKEDTNTSLMERLTNNLNSKGAIDSKKIRHNLDGVSNDYNEQFNRFITEELLKHSSHFIKVISLKTKLDNDNLTFDENIKFIDKAMKGIVSKRISLTESINLVKTKNNINCDKMFSISEINSKTVEERKIVEERMHEYSTSLTDATALSVMAISSEKYPYSPGFDWETIVMSLSKVLGAQASPNILAFPTSHFIDTDLLRKLSICKSLKSISSKDLGGSLYQFGSNTQLGRTKSFSLKKNEQVGNLCSIRAYCREPFTLVMVSEVIAKDSLDSLMANNFFQSKIDKHLEKEENNKKEMESLEMQNKDLEKEMKELSLMLENNEKDRLDMNKKINQIKVKMSDTKLDYVSAFDSIKMCKSILLGEDIKKVEEINLLLLKYDIQSKTSEKINDLADKRAKTEELESELLGYNKFFKVLSNIKLEILE